VTGVSPGAFWGSTLQARRASAPPESQHARNSPAGRGQMAHPRGNGPAPARADTKWIPD
jgi:hypothetical protein